MSWLAALRTRVRLALRRDAAESRMEQEFRFHLEMETDKNLRAGMSPDEARRQAALAFGGRQEHREQMRDERGLGWLSGVSLDLKLGLRMLAKAPGLAIIGGLGIALATAIGTGAFAVFNSYFWPELPLDEGQRVVTIVNWDIRERDSNKRTAYYLPIWQRELRSFDDLGAFRSVGRNLIGASGASEPIVAAEMSASGFRLARIAPLIGRALIEADEQPGAPPVVVIGHEVWQTRYRGDPAIAGQTMRLGGAVHQIVGVMPPGFAFPVSHSYWLPLRQDGAVSTPGQGPELDVFARLAPGVSTDQGAAELAILGRRLAESAPGDLARLEPRVRPYPDVFAEGDGGGLEVVMMQLTISLLLVVVCLNVAALVYARNVNRAGEIAVRTALGASRRRIVTQLFAEALVLSVAAALVGLGLVRFALGYFDRIIALVSETGRAPFWIEPGLAFSTVAYALGLATLGAFIIGVIPALRATGPRVQATMAGAAAGGPARLGSTWTFLIVAQVAIAVAVLPPALIKGKELIDGAIHDPGFPAEEYLWARFAPEALAWQPDGTPVRAEGTSGAIRSALLQLVRSQPDVRGATLAVAIPGNEGHRRFEIDSAGAGGEVRVADVSDGYFELFDVALVGGRRFTPGDAAMPLPDRPVVVNRSFEVEHLGGASAVGHRLRPRLAEDSVAPWRTVVGVVEDFPREIGRVGSSNAAVYQYARPDELRSGIVLTRFQGRAPAAFVPTLRQLAASVDPTLQLFRIRGLDQTYAELGRLMGLMALAVGLVMASVLLLSAGGIHALMSFTINRQRREIGIRSALGADARRILTSVLARAAWQLALGVAVGLVLGVGIDRLMGEEGMGASLWPMLFAIAGIMAAVGLAAAAGPARQGLRIQPTEALRSD